MASFQRVFLIILDSVGIGEMPDAAQYGDRNVHTLGHVAIQKGGLYMPTMQKLGLGNIVSIQGVLPQKHPMAYYAKMAEASNGKDTMTGHWEFMGLKISKPFQVFPNGFPTELLEELSEKTGRKFLGNKPASGTEILKELGDIHVQTGAPILYTSADSVLQIAAHEEVVPLEELYQICEIARELTLKDAYKVGRVIARPFIGMNGSWTRTSNRHDYALKPFEKTVMNTLSESGFSVIAIGKINDIYDGEGVTRSIRTTSNMDGMDQIISVIKEEFTGLVFLNLVDFDAIYGHRRDSIGYGDALEAFDQRLAGFLPLLQKEDLLIISADHGNDPTAPGTDHTREYVPLLVYSPSFIKGGPLDLRQSFADVGATIAENFQVTLPKNGQSFLKYLK